MRHSVVYVAHAASVASAGKRKGAAVAVAVAGKIYMNVNRYIYTFFFKYFS